MYTHCGPDALYLPSYKGFISFFLTPLQLPLLLAPHDVTAATDKRKTMMLLMPEFGARLGYGRTHFYAAFSIFGEGFAYSMLRKA